MYCKGDKIVYPMYGAGVIEELESKEVNGMNQVYYVLRLPVGNLKISISAGKAEIMGLRQIYSKEKVMETIQSICDKPVEMSDNWNQRQKDNMEKIRTGKLSEVALVFRNLVVREKNRGLSSAEKKMQSTAKQIILSELILSQNIEKSRAEEILSESMEIGLSRLV